MGSILGTISKKLTMILLWLFLLTTTALIRNNEAQGWGGKAPFNSYGYRNYHPPGYGYGYRGYYQPPSYGYGYRGYYQPPSYGYRSYQPPSNGYGYRSYQPPSNSYGYRSYQTPSNSNGYRILESLSGLAPIAAQLAPVLAQL